MKNNRKNTQNIIILFSVIIFIVILFFISQKPQDNKINNNKGTIKTEESDKSNEKTSEGNATNVKDESGENNTGNKDTKDTKDQGNEKATGATNSKEGITVFAKTANFGSTADLVIDNSNFSSNYKYYQFFLGSKPISNIEGITKSETTIYPAQEAGSEVVLKLLDENKKVLKELKIILNEKK